VKCDSVTNNEVIDFLTRY